jgi:hypothetical protein
LKTFFVRVLQRCRTYGAASSDALIPKLIGEDALAARALEGEPEAANAAEEVDETQGRALSRFCSGAL